MRKNIFKKAISTITAAITGIMSISSFIPSMTAAAAQALTEPAAIYSQSVETGKAKATTYTGGTRLICTPSSVNVKAGERQLVELSYDYGPSSYVGDYPDFDIEDEAVVKVVKADYTWGFYVEGLKKGTTSITITHQYGDTPLTTVLPVTVTEDGEVIPDDLSKTGVHVVIDSEPTHIMYALGGELDLSGGTFSVYFNGGGDSLETIYSEQPMTEYANIDTSAFDNTRTGTYTITITYNHYTGYYNTATFDVHVFDPANTNEIAVTVPTETVTETVTETETETTTTIIDTTLLYTDTTTTTATTAPSELTTTVTTTTPAMGIMCHVSEIELNAGERGIISLSFTDGRDYSGYLASLKSDNPAVAVAQNSDTAWSFYVIGVSEGTAVITVTDPQYGYTTELKVTVKGSYENGSASGGVTIVVDSLPDKLVYNVGEELDLTGGVFSIIKYPGESDELVIYEDTPMTNNLSWINKDAFDSSTPGTYPVIIAFCFYDGSWDMYVFDVTVTDGTESIQGDIDGDNEIGIADATLLLEYYAKAAAGLETADMNVSTSAADIDGDGEITINDATLILTFYANTAAGIPCTWDNIIS